MIDLFFLIYFTSSSNRNKTKKKVYTYFLIILKIENRKA